MPAERFGSSQRKNYDAQVPIRHRRPHDLGAKHNLAAEQPEKAAELRQRLQTWRAAVGARMPMPNPNHKANVPE